MAKKFRSAHEWLRIDNNKLPRKRQFVIKDDDGWRRGDGVTLDTPITHDDFRERLIRSTVVGIDA
jgi:hypothetical protein